MLTWSKYSEKYGHGPLCLHASLLISPPLLTINSKCVLGGKNSEICWKPQILPRITPAKRITSWCLDLDLELDYSSSFQTSIHILQNIHKIFTPAYKNRVFPDQLFRCVSISRNHPQVSLKEHVTDRKCNRKLFPPLQGVCKPWYVIYSAFTIGPHWGLGPHEDQTTEMVLI